jgi:hypothetical protein
MKLPLKHIILLVICSLAGIFVYQTYWLTGLYRTMKQDVEDNIRDAMRMSDFNEVVIRAIDSTHIDSLQTYVSVTSDTLSMPNGNPDSEAYMASREGIGMVLNEKNNIDELVRSLQQGMHSGLDLFTDIDLQLYDSLLTAELHEHDIHIPHRTLMIHTAYTVDSSQVFIDTLATVGDSAYIPTPRAIRYDYAFNQSLSRRYQLITEPVAPLIWQRMAGILLTSCIIFLIQGFSFWFLIHTLLRQKALDEMKSNFTNNITHELKTPIAVAYAANDALINFNQADDKEKRDRYLHISQDQLQRLSRLV